MSVREIGSSDEFAEALNEASGPGRVVVAVFGGEGCMPCRALQPTLEELAAEHPHRLCVLHVDVDAVPTLATRLHVQLLPTVLFFRAGRQVDRTDRGVTPDSLQMRVLQFLH